MEKENSIRHIDYATIVLTLIVIFSVEIANLSGVI